MSAPRSPRASHTGLAARLRLGAGAAGVRKVSWLELFFDLVFVAAIAQVAEPLREHYDLAGVARFAVLFGLIWLAWKDHTTFASRFETSDALTRGLTLVQMFVVIAMAANAGDTLDSRSSAGFTAAYALLRLLLVAQYARARHLDQARSLTTSAIAGYGVAAALWLVSAVAPLPARYGLWAVAFGIDVATPWLTIPVSLKVPPNAHHLPERFGLFTLILLGESIVSVMHGMESHDTWTPAAASSAFAGMGLMFLTWWWYFEGAGGAAERPVRTRPEAARMLAWSHLHYPLYLGMVVSGVGIQLAVTAAARTTIDAADASILTGAAALLMIAMVAIGETAPRRDADMGRAVRRGLILGSALAAMGLASRLQSPVVIVLGIAALYAMQLVAASLPAMAAHRSRA